MEMYEMNRNMLTDDQWNPLNANKREEALSQSPQKQVIQKKNSTHELPNFK